MARAASVVLGVLIVAFIDVAAAARADDVATFADRADEDVRDADRTWAFLIDPLATAMGVYGGEVDFVVMRFAALAVEGDLYRRDETTGLAIGTGLLVYPLGSVLRQLYLEPRIVYARPLHEPITDFAWARDVVGVGATAGWQWTWDYGFSLRVGGGAMDYLGGPRSAQGPNLGVGPQLVLDGSLGWAF
jgi:hypothetical protein